MAEAALRSKKVYEPYKGIKWSIIDHKLQFSVFIDINKYGEPVLDLLPSQFGKCREWKCKYTGNSYVYNFICNWDWRRVENLLFLVDTVSTNLEQYVSTI